MTETGSQRPRANIELILLGFLVSLILKGLLDHVYATQIEHDTSWIEILRVLRASHPTEVIVFLFALLRFMYGAYRFHEVGPPSVHPAQMLWDVFFTVLLFIGFYLAGLLIKSQPIQFYEVFAVTHVVDLVWFFHPFIRFLKTPKTKRNECDVAAAKFVGLDVLTLMIWAAFFKLSGLLASAPTPAYPLEWLGVLLIGVGALDLWWNTSFYFHKIVPATALDIETPATRGGLIYVAAPLFTQAEWQWNRELVDRLEKMGAKISLPQRIARDVLKAKGEFDANAIFAQNIAAIDAAVVVIAILDGADADSGTSWECGYAHKAGKFVIGLRTDLRAAGDDSTTSTNLMLGKSCRRSLQVPAECREDVGWVAERLVDILKEVGLI